MGLLSKATSWRRLLLGQHPDARGIPAEITDKAIIARRELHKQMLAEQARRLGVSP